MCSGQHPVLQETAPLSNPLWLILHSYPGPREREMFLNLTGTPPTPCSSGRENQITQDCEQADPELRPEVVGQQSIDAVDLENEVSPKGLHLALTLPGDVGSGLQ